MGLQKVYAIQDSNGRPAIGFEFDKRGGELFYELTKGNIGKTLAVIIDGEVVSTPMIMSPLQNEGTVVGDFTQQEVERMVEALRKGMPPVKPDVQIEQKKEEQEQLQEQPVIRAVDNKATLASGLSIELLGVTRVPVRDQPWWKPDGSALEEPLFDWAGDPSEDPNWERFDYYAVAIRLKGKSPDEISQIKWHFSDANGYVITPDVHTGRKPIDYEMVGMVRFPKDVEVTTLRLSVASSEWETLFSFKDFGSYTKGKDTINVSQPYGPFGPLGAEREEKGLYIRVAYNIVDRDVRIIALDKNGKIHFPDSPWGTGGTTSIRRTVANFRDLTKERLEEYRFQVRSWERVEFKDISLRPGSEAIALYEKRKAARIEEIEKWLGEGQTRQIRRHILVLRDSYDIHEPCLSQVAAISAMQELVKIGSSAVPELIEELRRSQRGLPSSLIAFTLRAIGDPCAVPALIDGLGRSKYSGEMGIYVKDEQLAKFMLDNQHRPPDESDRKSKAIILGCPVIEITAALEKITGHTEGHEHFGHKATLELGKDAPHESWQQRVQEIVRQVADRWQKWWEQHKDEFISR